MPTMNKDKAQELIAQLERHQQGQIRCLQALFGLASGDEASVSAEVLEEVKGMYAYIAGSSECWATSPYVPS